MYVYIENGEENFKLNALCLTSFGLQNNSVHMPTPEVYTLT